MALIKAQGGIIAPLFSFSCCIVRSDRIPIHMEVGCHTTIPVSPTTFFCIYHIFCCSSSGLPDSSRHQEAHSSYLFLAQSVAGIVWTTCLLRLLAVKHVTDRFVILIDTMVLASQAARQSCVERRARCVQLKNGSWHQVRTGSQLSRIVSQVAGLWQKNPWQQAQQALTHGPSDSTLSTESSPYSTTRGQFLC
jgi:hypothetical protein